jgi:hypothetical protein
MPPPVVACPDGGGPSFDTDVLPIFHQVCDNCHAPDASAPERQMPYLTSYQQIYGTNGGSEARAINVQIFDNCAMPPANAPVPLSADQRQTLLAWLACGAPNSPAADASATVCSRAVGRAVRGRPRRGRSQEPSQGSCSQGTLT